MLSICETPAYQKRVFFELKSALICEIDLRKSVGKIIKFRICCTPTHQKREFFELRSALICEIDLRKSAGKFKTLSTCYTFTQQKRHFFRLKSALFCENMRENLRILVYVKLLPTQKRNSSD